MSTYDFSSNCHGYALGGGAYLIPPGSLGSIKSGDKWKTVALDKMKPGGNYVARYVGDHSATVTTVVAGPPVSVTAVTGKAGLMAGAKTTAPGAQWDTTIQYGPVNEYWEK
jgi:hypothetical protein